MLEIKANTKISTTITILGLGLGGRNDIKLTIFYQQTFTHTFTFITGEKICILTTVGGRRLFYHVLPYM